MHSAIKKATATLTVPLPWLSSLALKVEAFLEEVEEEVMIGTKVRRSLFWAAWVPPPEDDEDE